MLLFNWKSNFFTTLMKKIRIMRIILFFFAQLVGCSSSLPYIPETQQLDRDRLPTANTVVNIPNLGPCTDSNDHALRFNSNYPITVLVHGCNGSSGRFRSLAQLYAFHGQQAICYSYDDRNSLIDSSNKLISALNKLANSINNTNMSIIGHSMGGLVARKALENNSHNNWQRNDKNLKLITVSAPLAGIEDANTCGIQTLHWLSLGILPGLCWAITGDNWYEITSSSDFISKPEPLQSSVKQYLKVVTNERKTCRKYDHQGKCIESDHVFELSEQYHPLIDNYPKVTNVQIDAGHVEIIGYKQVAPRKLLSVLQRQGLLAPTPDEQLGALEKLLVELY